jgi:uncharacterized protein YqjF (DUF2071 family)
MKGVRFHYAPVILGTSDFPESNVRTHVTHNGKPGVWFFSLDAVNSLAMAVAQAWFHLPYYRARMRRRAQAGWIEYESIRLPSGAESATLRCRFRGLGDEFQARSLKNRCCIFSDYRLLWFGLPEGID